MTKYNDLYKIIQSNLNVISLCFLTGANAGKTYMDHMDHLGPHHGARGTGDRRKTRLQLFKRWINHYPGDSLISFPNTNPLDSDLSSG